MALRRQQQQVLGLKIGNGKIYSLIGVKGKQMTVRGGVYSPLKL